MRKIIWALPLMLLSVAACGDDSSDPVGPGGGSSTTSGSGGGATNSGGGGGGGAGGEATGGGGAGEGGAGVGGTEVTGGGGAGGEGGGAGGGEMRWVGTWATGPQLTETQNLPPAPGLANNTLRQVVYTSIGGSTVRLLLSNEFGNGPVTMQSVHVAKSTTADGIEAGTDRALKFMGADAVTIPAGKTAFSDPIEFNLEPLTKIAVTIHFGDVPTDVTGHPGSRTTSYIKTGDAVSAATLSSPVTTDHWYYITGLDVMAGPSAAAVITLGDSITDGRGSITNENTRWPDYLSRRLRANPATENVAVLNMGIGGNTVLSGGLGPTAINRFDRDVLGQRGGRWLIVYEGVNDIGGSSDANAPTVATQLIDAYGTFIEKAKGAGMLVYGVPILPFEGHDYYTAAREAARQQVNTWIRTSGEFDGVIDLDEVVRDPENPAKLLDVYDTGDNLHLNPMGYEKMAASIDLKLFSEP